MLLRINPPKLPPRLNSYSFIRSRFFVVFVGAAEQKTVTDFRPTNLLEIPRYHNPPAPPSSSSLVFPSALCVSLPSSTSVHGGTMRALKWAAGIALGIDPEEPTGYRGVNRGHSRRRSQDANSLDSGQVQVEKGLTCLRVLVAERAST